ncbi:MAG TPA: MoaD/ThiS family protein [Gemmatimonadales bacterium]|nr:MoaD/ThiS family protein [Gemmatimonadales bacterium]
MAALPHRHTYLPPMSAGSDRRVLTVRLFARYADLLGTDRLEIPAQGISTVRDLLSRIRSLPGGAAIAETALVAVNLTQARADSAVTPEDEVALLPPLAGG